MKPSPGPAVVLARSAFIACLFTIMFAIGQFCDLSKPLPLFFFLLCACWLVGFILLILTGKFDGRHDEK